MQPVFGLHIFSLSCTAASFLDPVASKATSLRNCLERSPNQSRLGLNLKIYFASVLGNSSYTVLECHAPSLLPPAIRPVAFQRLLVCHDAYTILSSFLKLNTEPTTQRCLNLVTSDKCQRTPVFAMSHDCSSTRFTLQVWRQTACQQKPLR